MIKTRRDLAEEVDKLLKECVIKSQTQTFFEGLNKLVLLIDNELGHKEQKCFSIHYDDLDEPIGYTHGRSITEALLNLHENDEEVREVKTEDCGICNEKD